MGTYTGGEPDSEPDTLNNLTIEDMIFGYLVCLSADYFALHYF